MAKEFPEKFIKNKEVCIWFRDGSTAYFKKSTKPREDRKHLYFEYYGESSQKNKIAKFSLDNIAGYSFSEDEDNE